MAGENSTHNERYFNALGIMKKEEEGLCDSEVCVWGKGGKEAKFIVPAKQRTMGCR